MSFEKILSTSYIIYLIVQQKENKKVRRSSWTNAAADLNIGFSAMTSYVMEELLPTGKRLLRPYPEAASNAHNHRHEVFDHENLEVGFTTKIADALADRARQRVE